MRLNDPLIECFDYVDEDEDRITVRCDEDFHSVIDFYRSFIAPNSDSLSMLQIYPRKSENSAPPPSLSDDLESLSAAPKIEPNAQNVSVSDFVWFQPSGPGPASPVKAQDFRNLGELGSGHCGRVWKAQHIKTNRCIAIKTIHLDESSTASQQQILRELSVLKRCCDEDAKHIITFIGAFFVDSSIHICTELMDGGSLERWMGRLPESVLGRMAVQVILGLCFLWSRKIMHRDVKPSNMLVCRAGVVKLCDFGVSIELERSIARTVTGTYAYMSPERIQGEDYRIPSDVWSLGVSLFELAQGCLPFASLSPTPLDLATKITTMGTPPLLPRRNASGFDLSDVLRDFVCGCMQRRPADRLDAESGLLAHPFYAIHATADNEQVVGQWLRSQLPGC